MKTIKYIFFSMSLLLLLTSCEKEITLDLPVVEPKIVIEGYIENGMAPSVIITKSAPYFDPIDINTLLNSYVSNAIVTVSDGNKTEQLSLDTVSTYPFYMYVRKSVYRTKHIIGEVGKRYDLRVEVDGNVYTSSTTISPLVAFDSLWYILGPENDTIGDLFALGTDKGNEYNYYRVFTKIIGKDFTFVPIFGSVWDDKFFNGETFTVQLYHGFASNIMNPDEDWTMGYKKGDTVIVKLSTMDYDSYKFWSAAESEILYGANPFTNTTSVPTNIQGGAIGCWTGMGSSYATIICN
ncbi:MAG: DUF4249 domain-containing protein [Bacteroidales bacterium]|nr:DUF4249 domain-containing protein [Bacteroidales bacterium]MDD4214131.1 DUF4249 domain-containing protein [Bacteroidales bacterium]